MDILFYPAAAVALVSTALCITRKNAVHAALYLVVSLLAVALVFFVLGAPLAGALEVVVYAGAILVLLIFMVMLLNPDELAESRERLWLRLGAWPGPLLLTGVLLAELTFVLLRHPEGALPMTTVEPREVARSLFGPYLIGVELVSLVLLAALVGAVHLSGREDQP